MATLANLFSGNTTAGQRKLKAIIGGTDAAVDAFQFESFARIAGKFQEQTNHVTPSQLFRACAEVIEQTVAAYVEVDTTAQDSYMPYLRYAKLLVKAWAVDGMLTYTPATKATSSGSYALNTDLVRSSVTALVRDAGKGQAVGFRDNKGTRHYQGACVMAKRAFSINVERAKVCRVELTNGNYLAKDDTWKPAVTTKEQAKRAMQINQFKALQAVYKHTSGNAFSFDVMPDFRGRLYYVAGSINPQAGGVAFYCLHNDNQITLDATASFAQFMSMVTGDEVLGASCGLTNYTDTPSDFYALTYAAATGLEAPAKNSMARLISKIYLMPKAYGCSDNTSKARAKKEANERGINEEFALGVVEALCGYEQINIIKDAASAKATELATEQNAQLSWYTPFGFKVTQNYYESMVKSWSVEGDQDYMPSSISFTFKTDRVCVSAGVEKGTDKTADIAAAANLIQSLDAAFLAEVANRYYEQTGETFTAIHDSATLDNPDHKELYMSIAWAVFCDMADSNRIKEIRALLDIKANDTKWINRAKVPNFICLE